MVRARYSSFVRWLLANLAIWAALFWTSLSWLHPPVIVARCEAGSCFTDPAWYEIVIPAALIASAIWIGVHLLHRLLRRVAERSSLAT
jgi:hypothetical protein